MSIYRPEQVETKIKYGIKAAQSEMCKATPDLEDVPCHFYVNSSLAIKQNEPFASIEGEAKLALPYGTDIRENDFVKSRGYLFRAGDVEDLKNKIEDAIMSKRLKEMGKKSKEIVEKSGYAEMIEGWKNAIKYALHTK